MLYLFVTLTDLTIIYTRFRVFFWKKFDVEIFMAHVFYLVEILEWKAFINREMQIEQSDLYL